jgi:hypothetical protein
MSEDTTFTPRMPKSVASAVVHVTRNINKLHRNERNKYAEYNYVSIDAFYEALGPLMADAGIFTIVDEASSTIDKGILLSGYEIFLVSETGEMYGPIRTNVAVKAAGPQAYASAKSYAEKYFLRQIFKVPTGEKVDADMHDKDILPNVEPQMKKFDKFYSQSIKEELIKGLQDCNSIADLKKWEAANNNGVKRKLNSDDAAAIDDEYDRVKKLLTRTEK